MAFWGAWVLAGMVGTMLPYLGTAFGWFGPVYADGNDWIAIVVSSVILAFPQYIVLRLLIGHPSFAGAMWIPVSVVAWLASNLTIEAWAERIINTLLSFDPIQALLASPFPFFTLVTVVENITIAAVLGLAQGLLLARVFVARSAARLWFVGNVLAATVVSIVAQIQINGQILINGVSYQTNQVAVQLLLPTAILGAVYAAVTGIALVALPRRDPKGPCAGGPLT
jgi:hypothetical protein